MKVLIISANGFEDTELLCPMYRLREEGFQTDIASLEWGEIKGKHGYTVTANLAIHEVVPHGFSALLLPGGKAPERLRRHPKVIEITKAFHRDRKPIFAICHGPLILADAGILFGKRATCYWKVAEELRNAGAHYEDSPLVVDGNITTSREPKDLPIFMKKLVKTLNP